VSPQFSVDASERSTSGKSLHPALQAALASLDVQLDEELARYRRQRSGRPVPPARGLVRQPRNQSLDLISIPASGGRTNPPPTESQPPIEPDLASQLVVASHPQSTDTATEIVPSDLSDPPGDLFNPAAAHLGPDDYLESSEQLLKSLAEEEAKVRVERNFMQSLLTPLGLSSMMLLILLSTAFGYIVMNPSSLTALNFKRILGKEKTNAPNPSGAESVNEATGIPSALDLSQREFQSLNLDNLSMAKAEGTGGSVVQSALPKPKISTAPKVAAIAGSTQSNSEEEAAPTIAASTVEENVQPAIATTTPTRSAPPIRSAPRRTYTAPAPRQPAATSSVSAPRVLKPVPAPAAPAPVAPTAESSTRAGDYKYKVVTPYDSDRTLEQAQKTVPDAYVRNFPEGAQIQMGAFSNETEAQERAQQLQKQGISAEVYRQ
jgi:hypothetical protein